jgi:uncharacterized membrane protein
MKKLNLFLLSSLCLALFSTAVKADNTINEHFSCIGTEPFWGLKMSADDGLIYEAKFSVLGDESSPFDYDAAKLTTQLSSNAPNIFAVESTDKHFWAFVERALPPDKGCNDGMSDRVFPYFIRLKAGAQVFSGCCDSNIYPARDEHNHP